MENNKILSSVLYYLTYIIDSYPQKKKKLQYSGQSKITANFIISKSACKKIWFI